MLVKELARTLERQFAGNAEARAAGMVINTMGWVEGVGYEVFFSDVVLKSHLRNNVQHYRFIVTNWSGWCDDLVHLA